MPNTEKTGLMEYNLTCTLHFQSKSKLFFIVKNNGFYLSHELNIQGLLNARLIVRYDTVRRPKQIYIHTHIYLHTQIYIYTHTYTFIHTHTHSFLLLPSPLSEWPSNNVEYNKIEIVKYSWICHREIPLVTFDML